MLSSFARFENFTHLLLETSSKQNNEFVVYINYHSYLNQQYKHGQIGKQIAKLATFMLLA